MSANHTPDGESTRSVSNVRQFVHYLGGNVAVKALGLLSIPILTHLMTTAEYGIVNMFNAYVAILVVVMTMGTTRAVGRYYYEERADFPEFLGSTAVLTAVVLGVSSLPFFLFGDELARLANVPAGVVVFVVPVVVVQTVRNVFEQLNKARRRSAPVAGIQVVGTYGKFAVTVGLLFVFSEGEKYYAPLVSGVGVGLLLAIYCWFDLRSAYRPHFSAAHAAYIVRYSVPLIPYFLGGVILGQLDRIMIGEIDGPDDSGLYSLAYNIGMLLLMVVASLRGAWAPQYFELMGAKRFDEVDRENARIVRVVVAASIMLVVLGKPFGVILADERFHGGLDAIPPVVVGYVFYALFTVYGRNIDYEKRTYFASLVMLASGALNIALNAAFIPTYGYIAAAYSTAFSYAALAFMTWFVARSFLRAHCTPIGRLLLPLLPLAGMVAACEFIDRRELGVGTELLIKVALAVPIAGVLVRKELRQVAGWRGAG